MNAAGSDAILGIDGDDSFSCLLGECGGVVRDGFPDSVGCAGHYILLMHEILLRAQA